MHRVALQLAAQTVVLLLVMLIVLEVVLYLVTQRTLVDSLQTTLRNRARQPDPSVCLVLSLPCPGLQRPPRSASFRPGGTSSGLITPTFVTQTKSPQAAAHSRAQPATETPSDASRVFFDAQGKRIHYDGGLSGAVLNRNDVLAALRTGHEQCCSTSQYKGQGYLVYTAPLLDRGKTVGAVQTVVSESQYESTMRNLLGVLLLVGLLGLVGSAGISVALSGRALQPIRLAMNRQRDFVADAAHELRTPLAIMRTVGEVGMDESSPDELQSTIAQMLAENQHLTRLVEDLSLLARSDTDAMVLERQAVDLSKLATDTTDELRPLAEGQRIALTANIQPDISGLGDTIRLRQLMLILLDNALKHTPEDGTVTLTLSAQGDRAKLEVADTGPGISPVDLPRIFDRFYRAEQAREGEGSGLGLAIGKWIAEAHGGQIQAWNRPPHGATFSVTLPIG